MEARHRFLRGVVHRLGILAFILTLASGVPVVQASYVNFEASHVHPLALTPSRSRLLAVNTPDARLEVFTVNPDGSLTPESSIPVGLEPVTVTARTDAEAWVVNNLSDTVTIVDLDLATAVRTIAVGDEPTDVVFAQGKAFVAVSNEDAVRVFSLSDLTLPPVKVDLFGRNVRALAVSKDGTKVYAVVLKSGNQTTVLNANVIFGNGPNLDLNRLTNLGLNEIRCTGPHPPDPPLPPGVTRNSQLIDPPSGVPPLALIVKWNPAAPPAGQWQDEAGQNWTNCLPFRLPDHDLFIVDAISPSTSSTIAVDHLGTTLFDVSVRPGIGPGSGRIYVPNTDARNFVRFELPPSPTGVTPPSGVQGHMVDNQLTVVDPASPGTPIIIDLNAHINRFSDPTLNIAERQASISQPTMMVWKSDGSAAYLTAIGSRKLFVVDGNCLSGGCIFGPTRANPNAIVVGEGPTGVALHEGLNRLYVLNRFSNSIAVVNAATVTKIGEVPLHDPSSDAIKRGRHFLYDGMDTSGHGDAACSSCHISGDNDGLAWDLGNPTGDMVPYSTPFDNVRFIVPLPSHLGFDPQKGPMTTQTLRAMLEPLHWRGDRPTMRSFNKAFVGLMGTKDIGPVNGEPAGLSATNMDLYRSFALDIQIPPNPNRLVDDSLPDALVQPFGSSLAGNPTNGETLFTSGATDAGLPCASCHTLPFGAAGGKLGGVEPQEPASPDAAGLFNGNADGSPHSDLKVPHLRNLFTKFGPRFGPPAGPFPDVKGGFGYTHDGSIPDIGTFLSAQVFSLTPAQAKDIATFMFFFPTGNKSSVGRQVTVPAGAPPTGSPADESLLGVLLTLGDLASAGRHCELVASARSGGRQRTWFLSGGVWTTDLEGEAQVTTAALRSGAQGPVSFLCATLGSGVRLGADLDEDGHLNGSDCSPADPQAWALPGEVTNVQVAGSPLGRLSWDAQTSPDAQPIVYDVAGGTLQTLRLAGLPATSCLAGGLPSPTYDDGRAAPTTADGYYYLVQARKTCGAGGYGPGSGPLNSLVCSSP